MTWRIPRPGTRPRRHDPLLAVTSREQLVWLLTQAAEIEHGVMCQYLYAAFSLKRGADEGVTEAQLDRIRAWEAAVVEVAVQEMLHLALATNLLTALGASPHLGRPNFPILSGWYPPGIRMALLPFGEEALQHFIHLERPDGMSVADALAFGAPEPLEAPLDPDQLSAGEQDWTSIGNLYHSIKHGLETLVARDGADAVFIGPAGAQARGEAFRWPDIRPIRDLDDARAAIEVIVEAGEGAKGDWAASHFGVFVRVLAELREARAADPFFEPARTIVPAYLDHLDDADAPVAVADDPLTRRVIDLFDAAYETALQLLARYFLHTTESADQLAVLARSALGVMKAAVRPIAIVLTALPVGPGPGGPCAGPGFAIPASTFYLLPHRDAAWRILADRTDQLARRAMELSAEPGLADLARVGDRMAEISTHLREGAPSRYG